MHLFNVICLEKSGNFFCLENGNLSLLMIGTMAM